MKRLDLALARFIATLENLETGAAERLSAAAESGKTAAEAARVEAERDRLLARIGSLEEDSRFLAGLTEEVENRLDGAISEIREVLGRN
jgi:hypothetical protein